MNKSHQKQQKRHQNCPMELRETGPHIGLYCQTHGKWMKWVSQPDAKKIRKILANDKDV